MKLLLRRDQKSSLMGVGKISFLLDVRAELTEEEKSHIKKYKLGDTLLYTKKGFEQKLTIWGMVWSLIKHKFFNLTISVKDLEHGRKLEAKSIVEMLSIENEVREAALTFKNILSAAAQFGGEEIVEIS